MSRLFAYYGDDFTGSADVMEALSSHGVKTVLFTRIPTPEEFAPFAGYEAIGLAGTSRSQTPEWMERHLPVAFEWLRSLGAHHCHYKICSTLDSSPRVGNIAKAAEIGLQIHGQKSAPLIVGAPGLKRYTFAGHLFAAYRDRVFRIDRHPVMSVHPVTPMNESDVLAHLARQGAASFDLFDVYDDATLREAGDFLKRRPGFVVGSSGVESAALAVLGRPPDVEFAPVPAVERMLVVSGSVSPTTQRQIEYAGANGFALVAADPMALARGEGELACEEARVALLRGQSPLLFSASGPATDQGGALDRAPGARETLSRTLGVIAKRLIEEFRLQRVVIAGGDTSSHAIERLGIRALTMRFPLLDTPGSPLCMAHSLLPAFSGLDIAMKGGQIGRDDYFVRLRDGFG